MSFMSVDRLSFSYPGRHLFTGWSAAFDPGLHWVVGANGCGKSTLLKLLAGAVPRVAGQLVANGVDEGREPLRYRQQVFSCGSGVAPFEHLSPNEFFGFMLGLYPHFDVAEMSHQVQGFGFEAYLAAPLHTLSAGTQRKVWLAAALSAGTSVILLDEPVNALDEGSLQHLRSSLAKWAASTERSCIVASHDLLGMEPESKRVWHLG